MTLSRTARILIALLLVAAAAFVWINFFSNAPTPIPATPTVEQPAQPAETGEADAPAEGDAVVEGDAVAAGDATAEGDAPTVAVSPDGDAPTVVTTPNDAVVGREIRVAEFPFLVNEPPAEATEADAGEEGDETAEAGAGGETRASVNPFSPIVLPETASAVAEARPEATSSPNVETVDVPDAPTVETVQAEVPVPAAPAPRALAPAGSSTASLPRTLPGGTLPIAPDILSSPRAEPAMLTPLDLADRTAIREPDAPTASAPLPTLAGPDGEPDGDPMPLAVGEVPAAGTPDEPLVAGADGLARFLRDRNVAFTGSVVGSVGVGVFRVDGTTAPIVLALGQPLPDTEIVLTDLRGQAAEFTLQDTTHVLTLDLRR